MTITEQRKALAEWDGWTKAPDGMVADFMWAPGHIYEAQVQWVKGDLKALELSTYESLDDMARLEEKLEESQIAHWLNQLAKACGQAKEFNMLKATSIMIRATASQRRESLLRALGLWKD